MRIAFHGAARSVTGSRHLLQTSSAQLLLDCGMFQGARQESDRRNQDLGFDPKAVNAVLLSHAHIDHSGALPVLAKRRFSGKIHLTRGTADLTQVLLEDSARIQENDCKYVNKEERRRGRQCRAPYYDADDVKSIAQRFVGARYGDAVTVHPRIKASFHDAGHILGSAAVRVAVSERGGTKTILFTGDLGRKEMPILRDPASPPPCDVLIIESTYGDRLHEKESAAQKDKMVELVAHAKAHRSKIIVPAFAVGRTQDVVIRIKELVREGRIEPLPIFIDSPLAARATEIFRKHPECYDEETLRTLTSEGDLFNAKYIRYVSSVDDSKRLNAMKGPCLIIASSGMCEGGRILHHLKHAIQDAANVIVIVGFQAEHTLGRKLVEGWDIVPIFGIPTPRRAQVVRFNGLSAHADRNDLLAYVRAINPLPGKVFVVHGEEKQALSLAAAMQAEHSGLQVVVPYPGAVHEV
ncbi:MAG TPA: MBL fold metallo-hydrolase [Nitrospiraceae bacterium]|nr:MBL fold metallo-hydrolase [Nitrospiraceae bacterium]